MPRLFRCKSPSQAHIIRTFLLEHDIEAHVLHENANALWCGAVARSVLAIHETDLPFVMDAFTSPREQLTDDSEIPVSEFSETGPGPLIFDANFFLSLMFFGAMFALGCAALALGIELLLSAPPRFAEYTPDLLERRPQITLADVINSLVSGALGGLSVGIAIAFVREFRPDAPRST